MSAFTQCESGHDLTVPDAYILTSGHLRVCRACKIAKMPKRSRERYGLGSFNSGK
jgi:hypothetical protein